MRGLTGATELKTMRGSAFYKNVFKSSGFQGGREEKREGSENELLELILRVNGEGNGNPVQYSCLENFMDRGAWWATIHGVIKSQTRLSE